MLVAVGIGDGVKVGEGVKVGVGVNVIVAVGVTLDVGVSGGNGVGVAIQPPKRDIKTLNRIYSDKNDFIIDLLRILFAIFENRWSNLELDNTLIARKKKRTTPRMKR